MPGFAIINADDVVGGVPVDGAVMIYRSAATFEGAATPSYAAAMSPISPLFTPDPYINDRFNYPDGTVLSSLADYDVVLSNAENDEPKIKVFNGEAYSLFPFSRTEGLRFAGALPANQFCEVDLAATTGSYATYFMQVRLVNGTTFYGARVDANNLQFVKIYKLINGVETDLTLGMPAINISNSTWRLEAEGIAPTTLRLYKDGVLLRTVTDTSPELVTGGAGFRLPTSAGNRSVTLSRFQCGAI